jgi:hypothetical protein
MNITLPYIPTFQPITGIIIDGITLQPLPGVKISDKLNNTTITNLKGKFEFKTPILENGNVPKDFPLTINKKQYTINTVIPYSSTGDIKTNLGIIKLFTIEYSSTIASSKENETTKSEVDQYVNQFKTPEFLFQERLDKIKLNLKSKVIPLIYNIAAQYGVSQLNALVEKYKGELTQEAINELKELITCPPQEDINALISIKNKLVKQLNISYTSIQKSSKLLSINDEIVLGLDVAYKVLKFLPVPTAIAGVGIPISVVNNVQDAKDFLKGLKGKLSSTNTGITSVINPLEDILAKVISYLNFIDKLTQICSPDINSTQTQVSAELTALTSQQSNQQSPIVTNVNGFEMGVETEPTTNTLKRRRAIARNAGGVIMLTGEWSFSSIDQILIDELVFYIQQNDLKAD